MVAEELKLFNTLLLFNLLSFTVALLNGLNLRFEFDDFILELGLLGFKLFNLALEVGFAVLGLKLFSHSESD